jgi:signal peptidase I
MKKFLKEFLGVAILSIIIVLPIRIFIAQPFVVSGDSMDHTFANGNYLIVDELSYRFEAPKRGEVIVFKVPEKALELSHYALNKTVYFIKRIVGLPGETVQIDGDKVTIFNTANPNGLVLNEPYTYIDKLSPYYTAANEKVVLGPDQYFVMGDNRHNSSDSRYWGVLDGANIKGRALFRLFPFTQIAVFPGIYNQY